MLNRYSYVRNNPLKYTDPTGHYTVLINILSKITSPSFWQSTIRAVTNFISRPAPKAPSVKPYIPAPVVQNVSRQATSVKINNPPPATTSTGTGFRSTTSRQTTAPARGTQDPFVKQSTQHGQQMHKTYPYDSGYQTEVRLQSGKRVDALNEQLKHIIELKPNNPAAIRRGEKQVEGYLEELNKTRGEDWTGEILTYPSLIRP